MKCSILAGTLAAALALPLFGADAYVIDSDHSSPTFQVGHMGFSSIGGRFNKMQGKVTLDRAAKSGSISVDIDTTSVDTGLARRDNMLKGENWLNTEKYPTMSFKSSALKFNGDQVTGADGELTLNGVTKPVSLNIESLRCGPNPFNKREMCGATASTTIKRTDFGVKGSPGSVTDEVRITINIEAYKESA